MPRSKVVEKKQQKQVDDAIAYKSVFKTQNGKRVLNDLLRACGMLNSSYEGDPYQIVYREGQRSMVVRILNILKVDPGKLQAQLENMRKEEVSFYGDLDD